VGRRWGRVDAPTQSRGVVPDQLDRRDFPHAGHEWLLVVFSSATCDTCADTVRKAQVLASDAVAVVDVEWSANRELHGRYGIDAVPIVVVADRQGVVRKSFVGPVSASDLWSAVAEVRES
jgi:thioredoxin-like negative regulator of GroEL